MKIDMYIELIFWHVILVYIWCTHCLQYCLIIKTWVKLLISHLDLPGVYADGHDLYAQQYVKRHVHMFKAIIPLLHWVFFLHTEAKRMKHTFKGRKKKRTNWVLGIITKSLDFVLLKTLSWLESICSIPGKYLGEGICKYNLR